MFVDVVSLNSGTQPLYVIDGMPVNSETDGMSTTTNNNFDPMAAINLLILKVLQF